MEEEWEEREREGGRGREEERRKGGRGSRNGK